MAKDRRKVFISYAWEEKFNGFIESIARRLCSDGVDVVLDIWELKEGQNKYKFMERMVSDEAVDNVLVFCTRKYQEKANNREGGVGTESMIISAEVYEKADQTKFIPILLERSGDNSECVPTFFSGTVYVDLSDRESSFESRYEKLLRAIYDKPAITKPEIGEMPKWLDKDDGLHQLESIRRTIEEKEQSSNISTNSKRKVFIDTFIVMASKYRNEPYDPKMLIKNIIDLHRLLEEYLLFLEDVIESEKDIDSFVIDVIENINNSLLKSARLGYSTKETEHYAFFLWKLLLCTMYYLLHYNCFKQINTILNNTYFFLEGDTLTPSSFVRLRRCFEAIESDCKPLSEEPRLISYSAKLLLSMEIPPLVNSETLCMADIFLYQCSVAMNISEQSVYWYPITYFYSKDRTRNFWIKAKSERQCEKFFDLFAVKNLEELKEVMNRNSTFKRYRMEHTFSDAPLITDVISIEEIGIMK